MIRIAAVSDLHVKAGDEGTLRERFADVNTRADLLLLPGDLTDHGSLEEAQLLATELADVTIPTFAVLGNHDYASRVTPELIQLLAGHGIKVLDGEAATVDVASVSVGIAGARGFRGGFEENSLGETNEPEVEAWVVTAKSEAAHLRAALESLTTDFRVAMTHYSPVKDTIIGEHPETFPFYGSSRLCKAIDKAGADLAVHGHAHHGTHLGMTSRGIPVYNVAVKVIGVPYVVLELGE